MSYYVFEGVDASGKSTVSQLIHQTYLSNNIKSMWTHHPGSTSLGQKLRELVKYSDVKIDPFTEQFIMTVDHSAFLELKLKPALKDGYIVIADRSDLIGAYAYGVAHGNSIEDLQAQHAALNTRNIKADKLIIFDLPWSIARQRMMSDTENAAERAKCRIEKRGDEYFERVCQIYRDMSTKHLDIVKQFAKEVHVIDASKDIDTVFDACYNILTNQKT